MEHSATRSRYARTAASTTRSHCARGKPRWRATTWRLAAKRLTSHSHGPGKVSSKSLMSKTRLRSGVANFPKFETCASPHAWTRRPVCGDVDRSIAITAAAPRKNANGDSAMRRCRIGSSSRTRASPWVMSTSTGSRADAGAFQSACAVRGTSLRSERPWSQRSSHVIAMRSSLATKSRVRAT